MGVVLLHHAGYSVDALEQKGKHRDLVFLCQHGVGCIELLDVVGAVVWREGDSGERHLGAAGFEGGDDLVEVGAGIFDGQAAQAVVAAEFDYDNRRLEVENGIEPLNAIFGGVAADALVDDAVVVAASVEIRLKVVGIALAGVCSETGGEAVAEADQDRAVVRFAGRRWSGGLGLWLGSGGRIACCGLLRGLVFPASAHCNRYTRYY